MNTEKILLVDDERAIRLAVRTALTREGMQVTEQPMEVRLWSF